MPSADNEDNDSSAPLPVDALPDSDFIWYDIYQKGVAYGDQEGRKTGVFLRQMLEQFAASAALAGSDLKPAHTRDPVQGEHTRAVAQLMQNLKVMVLPA